VTFSPPPGASLRSSIPGFTEHSPEDELTKPPDIFLACVSARRLLLKEIDNSPGILITLVADVVFAPFRGSRGVFPRSAGACPPPVRLVRPRS